MPRPDSRPGRIGRALMLGAALGAFAPGFAFAQAPASLDLERRGGVVRLQIQYPEELGEGLSADIEIQAGAVLVATLSEPASLDLDGIEAELSPEIARARLDGDGRTLRLALNQPSEAAVSVSHNVVAIDLFRPGAQPLDPVVSDFEIEQAEQAARRVQAEQEAARAAAEPPPPLDLQVRWGEASDYTRIEFVWPARVDHELTVDDDRATLAFNRAADADLRDLRLAPPRLIEMFEPDFDADGFSVDLRLSPGATPRVWTEDDRRIVLDVTDPGAVAAEALLTALADLEQARAQTEDDDAQVGPESGAEIAVEDEIDRGGPAALTEIADEPEPARADDGPVSGEAEASPDTPESIPEDVDPVPESGVVTVGVRHSDGDVLVDFDWASPPGAAVFRRGDALWVVFDAAAELDADGLSGAARRHVGDVDAVEGDDFTALRIASPRATQADIEVQDGRWRLRLGDSAQTHPRTLRVSREAGTGRVRLSDPGARRAISVRDPAVGDRIWVMTAAGPERGVDARRRFIDAEILPSILGAAALAYADDVVLEITEGGAALTRSGGLTLSGAQAGRLAAALPADDAPRETSAGMDFEAWRGGPSYQAGRSDAERRAAQGDADGLIDLARFNLAWGLAAEALGAARLAVEADPDRASDPDLRRLMGAAQHMLGRHDRAESLLAGADLDSDSVAQLWAAASAARQGRWSEARRRFETGERAFETMDPVWRDRFAALRALAALQTGDRAAARQFLDAYHREAGEDPQASADAELTGAMLAAQAGETDAALERLEALGRAEWEPIQARALLEKLRLEREAGVVDDADAVERLESLRNRWRGGQTELETLRLLGQAYADAGRHAAAFDAWQAARDRFPDSALNRPIARDMDRLFARLFIEGEAADLDPVESLALFNEYDHLTPQGAEGDRMVRQVAQRLVGVDLLEPAAELLSHQVENRSMPGQARARIATDLAVIQLMDGRDEAALRTLRSTRIAGLPETLVAERRLLEARALSGLGRNDHALELIDGETSPEAGRLRADIAWAERDWPRAGQAHEALLGARWEQDVPLEPVEAHDALRAAIAYRLAGDAQSLRRVEARYGDAMTRTDHASAFSLAARERNAAGDARLRDAVASLAAREDLDGFLSSFAERFQDPAS